MVVHAADSVLEGNATMTIADEFIDDDDLLIEAARYAVKRKIARERFMKLAKQAWYQATTEKSLNPQTLQRMNW
jgi:hypothetical protein